LYTQPYAEDIALRDRVLAGDRRAAADLLDQHLDTLYEFVHYRVGGNTHVAEDLVQETLVVALERMRSFDGRSRMSTWLCGIAKNKIRAGRRKRKPVAMAELLTEADEDIDAILSAVDTAPLPDWILEQQETKDLVGATLSSLPPDYRRALLSKYVEELTVPQMAARDKKSEKATESHLARARLAFAKVFQLLSKTRGGLA
jgi:RNA polymerase sigma-70 factor (ECF subfamily)